MKEHRISKKKYMIFTGVIIAVVLLLAGIIWMNRAAQPLPTAVDGLIISGTDSTNGPEEVVEYTCLIDEDTELKEKFSELMSSLEYNYCPQSYFSFLGTWGICPLWHISYSGKIGDSYWHVTVDFDHKSDYLWVDVFEANEKNKGESYRGRFKAGNMEEWREDFYDFLRKAKEFVEVKKSSCK